MKALVLGVVGLGGVGAATYMGTSGGSLPDDYVGHVSKSPQAVYAAFSALGREGEISVPAGGGWGARLKQRITKVANEQVKVEVEVDGKTLVSAEFHFSPENGGTRLAAEIDFNQDAMNGLLREAGAPDMPVMPFEQDYVMDQLFAQMMAEAVDRIEDGKPLFSLAETQARWGNGGSTRGDRPSSGAARWQQREAVRPQMNARPALDPNAAARQHTRGDSGY